MAKYENFSAHIAIITQKRDILFITFFIKKKIRIYMHIKNVSTLIFMHLYIRYLKSYKIENKASKFIA